MEALRLKRRDNFEKIYLRPALEKEIIERTIPDKPNRRLQKYRITLLAQQALSSEKI